MLWFILLAAGVWVIQGLLGFWQLKHFNQRFKLLRKDGRVVVGKSKGRIMAGAVVMFCLDQDCKIIKGEKMEGISIFARMKPFHFLNNVQLLEIEDDKLSGLSKPTTKAVMNAVENYRAFINTAKSDVEVSREDNAGVTA